MPILDVDEAQAVVVLKRSMNPGFAGIENPLFYNPKTVMLFGDAKDSITKLIADVKTPLERVRRLQRVSAPRASSEQASPPTVTADVERRSGRRTCRRIATCASASYA